MSEEPIEIEIESIHDFSNVCRTCAAVSEFVIPIFEGEGLQNNLSDKISKHLPIQVCENDVLPRVVCYQCASTLLAWHEMAACCVQADAALRSRMPLLDAGQAPIAAQVGNRQNTTKNLQEKDTITPNQVKQEYDEVKEQLSKDKPSRVFVGENGKKYAQCTYCDKNIAVSSWRRHVRLHQGERRYSCPTCGLSFNDNGNLSRHTKALHGKQRPHACGVCNKRFSRSSHLQEHVQSHSERREYVCEVCGAASKSPAALRMHAVRHGARRHACVPCGAAFVTRGELAAHASVHSGATPHRCRCGRAFRLRAQLTAHARAHHGSRLTFRDIASFRAPPREPPKYTETSTRLAIMEPTKTCQFCKSEVAERVYEDHLVGAHALLVFVCEECNYYIDRKLFLTHMSNHAMQYTNAATNTTKPPETIVKNSKNMDLNQNTKPPPKYPVLATRPRIAPKEEKELPNELPDQSDMDVESGLVTQSESNEDSQVQQAETKPFDGKLKKEKADTNGETKPKWSRSCPICFKRYTASSSFFYHMKHSHTTTLEHECDVCGKKFASKATLVQHGAVHSDEYKYPCKSCDKRFKSRAGLYIHVQTHGCATQTARHTCDTCGRGFRWRVALSRHVARHAGARAHSCARCGLPFVTRGDLLRHARTHDPAPLDCTHCGLQFAQQRYLNVHVANKHSDKQNTK